MIYQDERKQTTGGKVMQKLKKGLSAEEMDLLCAPKATDDMNEIDFEEDDAGVEEDFIQGWIEEERAYIANL